jgi:hypothetical protein
LPARIGGLEVRGPICRLEACGPIEVMKRVLYIALVVLFVLHNDLWLWNDTRLIAGIPSGLLYHIIFCVAATLVMTGLTIYAWPEGLEVNSEEPPAV